jgi:pentatricopeptide repeat protein
MKRAAICIGIDCAANMPPLNAAAAGASDFADWANAQECETRTFTDADGHPVILRDIAKAVREYIHAGTCEQLIVYFSGHGILKAPETEYWLLSDALHDPNEAVNVAGSIANARDSGIPHIVFVSDACRSAADSALLRGVTGGVIFPTSAGGFPRSEIDVFYATQPGDPAYEVPVSSATQIYKGIFTEYLLDAVWTPAPTLIETIEERGKLVSIVPSWKLKPHLETGLPVHAATIDMRLRQRPELRVESHLPKFFARLTSLAVQFGSHPSVPIQKTPGSEDSDVSLETVESLLRHLGASEQFGNRAEIPPRIAQLARDAGILTAVEDLSKMRSRAQFAIHTGFTVRGAQLKQVDAPGWNHTVFPHANYATATHVGLEKNGARGWDSADSILLELESGVGTVLAVLPGFIGMVVFDGKRVVSVEYVPSDQTHRYAEYLHKSAQLDQMRAFAAVAARHGRFVVEGESASQLADRIRIMKGLDPSLGIYAAYAYSQAGKSEDAADVFRYMQEDDIPIPFDVAMLASRFDESITKPSVSRLTPFCPMLTQGWAFLSEAVPLFRPIHARLQGHLIPSLWSCFDPDGVALVRRALETAEIQ